MVAALAAEDAGRGFIPQGYPANLVHCAPPLTLDPLPPSPSVTDAASRNSSAACLNRLAGAPATL